MNDPRENLPYLHLTQASTIQPRPVKWLWDGRIPLGALSLVGGREGIGKSSVLYTCGADLTRGRLRGEFFGTPRNMIVAATEDSWEHTIVPRLMATDADLERVYRVDVAMPDGLQAGLCLPRDIPALESQARDVRAAWTLLDPLTSRLDGKLNQNYDGETRRALEPLSAVADVTRMAMTGIIHVNKGQHEDVLSTIMGSRAFVAVARTVLIVMADPDDDTIRLVGLAKNNLGPVNTVPTLKYTVESAFVCDTPEGPVWTGKVQWQGESAQTIREAFATTVDTSGDKTALSEACDWLADYLTSAGVAVESATVKKAGKDVGHSVDALKRARLKLKIASVSKDYPRRTFWSLPSLSLAPTTLTTPTALTKPTTPTDRQSVQLVQENKHQKAAPTAAFDPSLAFVHPKRGVQ